MKTMKAKTGVDHAMTKAEAADFFEGVARSVNWDVMREASLLAAAALRRSVKSTRAAKKAAIERRKAARGRSVSHDEHGEG